MSVMVLLHCTDDWEKWKTAWATTIMMAQLRVDKGLGAASCGPVHVMEFNCKSMYGYMGGN
jgi:hypothetical protein